MRTRSLLRVANKRALLTAAQFQKSQGAIQTSRAVLVLSGCGTHNEYFWAVARE